MKAVGYTRKVLKEDGTTADEAVEAQLYVKPGAEPGLLETLEGQGDQGVHVLPGDVEIELVVLDDPYAPLPPRCCHCRRCRVPHTPSLARAQTVLRDLATWIALHPVT